MASSSTPPPSSDIASSWPLAEDGSSRITHFSLFKKPSSQFVGRIKLLSKIHTQLMICSSKSKWWERMVIIYGPPGIGKSEMARMYAHLFLINPSIQNIAWIDSGNLASLKKSFASLAKSLGIEIKGKEVERVVEIIYTYFSDHIGTGLFIFDDAKQMRGTHMEIFKFLPRHYLARPPLILMTSRSDKWEIKKEHMICLDGLNDKEAVTFLCKRLHVSEEQKNYQEMLTSFEKLAKALHGFPLALALTAITASNIKIKTSSKIDDITAKFMMNAPHSNKDILNMCINMAHEALGDEKSKSHSWKLLNILSYLPHDALFVKTVEEIFKYIFKKASKPEDFSALEKCSLIALQNHDLDHNGGTYRTIQVSQQIQKWTRKRLHSMKEAPFYYLTKLCDYYCYVEDFTYLEVATASLHSHLRKLKWPEDSVKYSILFAAKLIGTIESTPAQGSAWEMVRDVYKYRTDTPREKLPPVGEEFIKLLHLCQYFFNKTSTHDELVLFNKPGMEISDLEQNWLKSVKSYIKHNFFSVTLHDGYIELYSIETLQYQIIHNLIMKKHNHQTVVKKAIRNLLLEYNPSKIMEMEATHTYYKLLWKYCWHSECIESLVVKLCALHFRFYRNIYWKLGFHTDAMYWENGPLPYFKLVNLLLNNSKKSDEFEWSSQSKPLFQVFLASFFAQGNENILSQHLEYLSRLHAVPPEAELLLQFVTCLAMDPNKKCADDLAEIDKFIFYLCEFTHPKLALNSDHKNAIEFWCNVVWLALYARSKTLQLPNLIRKSLTYLHPSKLYLIMFNFSPSVISQLYEVVKINENIMEKAVTELVINVLDLWKDKFDAAGKLKLWNPKHAADDMSPYKPLPEMSIIASNEAGRQDIMLGLYHDFVHACYKEEMEALVSSSTYSIDAEALQKYHESSVNKAIKLISEAAQLTNEQAANVQQLLKESVNNYNHIYSNMQEKTGHPIGIDFGTSYCCMAVVRGAPLSSEVIIDNSEKSKIPSYLSFPFCDKDEIENEDGYEINVGTFAESLSCENPKGTIFDLNRMIGRKFYDPMIQHDKQFWPFDIIEERGGIKVVTGPNTSRYPSEIIVKLIKWLKQTADNYLGYRVTSAVIAFPVNFTQHQKELLTQACEEAGLQIFQLVTQPFAAAVAYSIPEISNNLTYSKNCLIFDLGGGTLDLAFFEVTEGQVHVKAIGGDDHLGGRDIDNNLVQYCIQEFFIKHRINLNENKTAANPTESLKISERLRRLQIECERQKLHLSNAEQIIISLKKMHNDLDMSVTVTREIFDKINMGLFKRCIEVLKSFLENHSIPRNCIDNVVITGGSSRIPCIQTMLSDFFGGKPLCKNVDPDNSVALGAALLAYHAQHVRVSNILLQDFATIPLSEHEEPIHIKPMISSASDKKPDILIDMTANTFKISMCKELNMQYFTELIAIPSEVYFADKEILIGAKAHEFSSSALSYIKERYFNIFQLINSPQVKTHRLNIEDTKFTLCTAHVIAAFFFQVFNLLNIGKDGEIILKLPLNKTCHVVEKILKSLNVLGYFNIRVLPSLVTTAVASLDTVGYYQGVKIKNPLKKCMFVLDIQIDSFSMEILRMLPKRISVISSRRSESFAACQVEGFSRCHADWYKGVEIPQEWKNYIQIVYELLIDLFSDILRQAYANFEAVVINEYKASHPFMKMVVKVLGAKFSNFKISRMSANSLLEASLLASPLSVAKSLKNAQILDPNMEVGMTGVISKFLILTTNIEGEEVKIKNFTRQKFKISTDVTPTSKEETKHMYVLLQETTNRIDGDQVTYDVGYYQCRVKKNKAKLEFPVSKSIEFEIICYENLDGFVSLNVVNEFDSNFEILLIKKHNVVCNSVCVSPASSEFRRLISFYDRPADKTKR